MTSLRAGVCVVCAVAAIAAQGQVIQWNFGSVAPGDAMPTADSAANVSGGAVYQGNNNGTTISPTNSSASSGYIGASGYFNVCAAARTGALNTGANGSAYFEFTLTPSAGYTLMVTNLSLGLRSSSTGPTNFCLRSSLDGYAVDSAVGSYTNNSAWHLRSVSLMATSTVAGAAVTFRVYGYNGVGSAGVNTANWRIDDLTVAVNAQVAAASTPPGIEQVTAQSVRAGRSLGVALAITPTDGDDVTVTNVTASSGVTGAWSLSNGRFSYAPEDADVGSRSFTFDVADKDGTNSMTMTVNVLRRQTEAVRLTAAAGSYAQSFDSLAASGSANEWDNAAYPLAAWTAYTAAEVTTYRAGSGSDNSGGIYSWGTGADRSLGSLASSGNDYRYGVAFTNETGQALTNLTVGFTAEQWRVGASLTTNTLVCELCVTNRALPLTQGAWRRVASLCFDSPAVTNASQAAGAAYFSAAKSTSFTRPIPAGAVVLLRWTDADDTGNDHGFGIDDLQVSWAAGVPPDAIPVGRGGVTESFDDMGAAAAAELPWLWRVESRDDAARVTGRYADASERTLQANAVVNFTWAGSYNFSATAAGDQAVGGLATSNAARTVTLFGKFRNASGQALRRWEVAYNVEKYRNGLTGCAVRLLSSADGETWAEAGEATAFEPDADTNGYAAGARPGATVAVTRSVRLAESVAPGGVFYLAWQISATAGESTADAQALGVDDVRVAPQYPRGTLISCQ